MECLICKGIATGEVNSVRVCKKHLKVMTMLEAQRHYIPQRPKPKPEPEEKPVKEPEFKFVPEYKRRKKFYGKRYISTAY